MKPPSIFLLIILIVSFNSCGIESRTGQYAVSQTLINAKKTGVFVCELAVMPPKTTIQERVQIQSAWLEYRWQIGSPESSIVVDSSNLVLVFRVASNPRNILRSMKLSKGISIGLANGKALYQTRVGLVEPYSLIFEETDQVDSIMLKCINPQ